jgi:hypothetical protein
MFMDTEDKDYAACFPAPIDMLKSHGLDITAEIQEARSELPIAPLKDDASKIIVSAGGIGSAVILRTSGIERAGYDFFFDPLAGVRGVVESMDVPPSEIPMSAGIHMEDEDYMMTDMSHASATTALFAAQVLRFGQMFSRRRTLQIMVKANDELGGHLTDSGGVRKIPDKKMLGNLTQ